MVSQMPTGGGSPLPPELAALIAQIVSGAGGGNAPPLPSTAQLNAGGMPQGVTGADTGAPGAPGAPDLTGTQGNTPDGVQGLVLQAMQALLGPGGGLSPGAPGAPSPSRGLPPPAAMPGDVASGASRAVRPGMSAADYQRLLDPQASFDRTMSRPTGAAMGAPGVTPPPPPSSRALAMRKMLEPGQSFANTEPHPGMNIPTADVIRAMMGAGGGSGVPVAPPVVDPSLARDAAATARVPRQGSAAQPYVVQKGDTLSGIAQKTQGSGRKFTDIAARNPQISDVNKIFPGQRLNVPSGAIPGQVVGVDRGSKNHPPPVGIKKGPQAVATSRGIKNKFLAAAQDTPSRKTSGKRRY